MLDRFTRLAGVSTAVAVIILALVALQLGLQVYALVDLSRRDAVRGGRKWVWVLVIAMGNLPGAIAYLAAGRVAPTVDMSESESSANADRGDAARRAVEELYGPRGRR